MSESGNSTLAEASLETTGAAKLSDALDDGSEAGQKTRRSARGWGVTLLLLTAIGAAIALLPWADFARSFKDFPPPDSSGPYETRIAEVDLPGGIGRPGDAAFLKLKARMLYPIAPPEDAARAARGGWPLVIYTPGWRATAEDNDPLLLNLASYGYVVAAVDDVAYDEPIVERDEEAAIRGGELDYGSDAAFARTLEIKAQRVDMAAKKIVRVLDGLVVASHPDNARDFPVVVDIERVAAMGYGFGGAASLEAMAKDERIIAAVNLDGYLAGASAETRADGAYLEFDGSDAPVVIPGWLSWLWPDNKYAILEERMAREAARAQLDRPEAHFIQVWGAQHPDFSSTLHGGERWRGWRPWLPPLVDPERMRVIVDAYLLAFFQTYLLGEPHELMTRKLSPFAEVRLSR